MARKNRLDPTYQTATALIGIVTNHRDYRLVHFLNQQLCIHLSSNDDLPVYNAKSDSLECYPFYICHHEDLRTDFFLISNFNGETHLFPSLKQLHFIFVMLGPAYHSHVKEFVSGLRKIQGVQAAIPVNQEGLKEIAPFLEDLELHRIAIQKKEEDLKDKLFRSEE